VNGSDSEGTCGPPLFRADDLIPVHHFFFLWERSLLSFLQCIFDPSLIFPASHSILLPLPPFLAHEWIPFFLCAAVPLF